MKGVDTMRGRIENLKPFTSQQDREQARINGRKGGIASGEARRAKAAQRLREYREKHLPPWERLLKESTYGQLSIRHQLFIKNYILSWANGAEAARRSGYKPAWAKQAAYRLLRRRDIIAGQRCFVAYLDRKTNPADYPTPWNLW
jgi:hypothetical protein